MCSTLSGIPSVGEGTLSLVLEYLMTRFLVLCNSTSRCLWIDVPCFLRALLDDN